MFVISSDINTLYCISNVVIVWWYSPHMAYQEEKKVLRLMWRLLAKALGQKEGRDVKEADKIAIIRTLIMVQLVITNGFIIAGNIYNFMKPPCECVTVQQVSTPS